nr:unnamed protein product [Callosobruchus analis]
MQYLLWNVWQ